MKEKNRDSVGIGSFPHVSVFPSLSSNSLQGIQIYIRHVVYRYSCQPYRISICFTLQYPHPHSHVALYKTNHEYNVSLTRGDLFRLGVEPKLTPSRQRSYIGFIYAARHSPTFCYNLVTTGIGKLPYWAWVSYL